MLALVTSKLGLYAGIAVLCLALGFYGGHRWDAGQVATCRLQIAEQAQSDADAAATASAMAVTQMQEANAKLDAAESALATAQMTRHRVGQSIVETITQQAAQPGQDAPVAPVLANALAALRAAQ